MEIKKTNVDDGWGWYVAGWRYFVRNPGIQIGYMVIFLLIAIGLGLVPVIGGIVLALIVPVLMSGWFHAIQTLDSGGDIAAGTLFEGFRNNRWTGPLIVLGALMLAAQIVVGLAGAALLGSSVLEYATAVEAGQTPLAPGAGAILGLAITLILGALVFMAFFYAVPLVIFRSMAPVAALQTSFSASLRNIWPLSVFGLVYLVAAFIAAIPLGLGFLVLIPVTFAAVYASFRSVFGSLPEDAGQLDLLNDAE